MRGWSSQNYQVDVSSNVSCIGSVFGFESYMLCSRTCKVAASGIFQVGVMGFLGAFNDIYIMGILFKY